MTRQASLLGIALLLLGACAGRGSLITAVDGEGSYCAPGNSDGEILSATDFLINKSHSPVEITSVTPNDGDNLIVRDFSIGYREQGDFLGGGRPDEVSLSGTLTFEPGYEAALQVILALDDPDRSGYASSLDVRYVEYDGSERSLTTIFEFTVLPHGEICPGFDQALPTES